jgi:hypothetical protein
MGSSGLWPWLALAALGAYHGLNPAMGWLFAVALGLNRGGRGTVLLSLAPLALGHAAAAGAVLAIVAGFGTVLEGAVLARAAGGTLICWALWHAGAGHRPRLRVGMQAGLAGLALWSFLTAGAHGAGLMLVPAVLSLCSPHAAGAAATAGGAVPLALAALAVHTGAMLATMLATALLVYECLGVAVLRRGWINFDLLWGAALAGSGALLLAS